MPEWFIVMIVVVLIFILLLLAWSIDRVASRVEDLEKRFKQKDR